MDIVVLRLGHRIVRDKRITTHVSLVARAFGSNKIILSGEKDENILNSITKIKENWGGDFKIEYSKNWKTTLLNYKNNNYCVIHLTMYGELIQDKIKEIQKFKNLLIVVGGEKVPKEIYELADFNISITSQPHSEVAALAILLDKYFKSKELNLKFKRAKIAINPSKKSKEFLVKRPKAF